MSDDPVRDVFRALRQSRPDADGRALLAEAERIVAERAKVAGQGEQPGAQSNGGDIGGLATALHGIQSGLLMGFDDEVFGVINAVAPVTAGGTLTERYRQGRDAARELKAGAQAARPATYGAGQVVGAIPAGALTAPTTLLGAAALGAGMGAAGGLGGSGADLTQGEVGKAVADTAIGGAIGGAGGAAGYGVAKGVGKVVQWLRGAKGGAEKLAAEVAEHADEPALLDITKPAVAQAGAAQGGASAIGSRNAMTVAEAAEDAARSQALINRDLAGAGIGERFQYRPSQMTGDPAAAMAERVAMQTGETRRQAQAEALRQVRLAERWMDIRVARMAADPDSLGRADVSESMASTVDNHFRALTRARTAEVAPLFEAAEAAAGSKRIMPTTRTMAVLQELVDEHAIGSGKGIAAALQQDLDAIAELGTGTGRVSARDFQRLMSSWSKKAAGDVSISTDLGARAQRRISGLVLDAMRADLDAAGEGIASKEAASLLGQARTAWAARSQEIDDLATKTIEGVLNAARTDASENATQALARKTPQQITGVMRVLEAADPDVAKQVRAQLFEEKLRSWGKPGINSGEVGELGLTRFSPAKAATGLSRDYEQMMAIAGDSDIAKDTVRELARLTKRLGFGPGIAGSDTAPKAVEMATQALDAAGMSGGQAGRMVMGWLGETMQSNKAVALAVTDPEIGEIFNKALRAANGRERLTARTAGAMVAALARLGVSVAQTPDQQIEAGRMPAMRER